MVRPVVNPQDRITGRRVTEVGPWQKVDLIVFDFAVTGQSLRCQAAGRTESKAREGRAGQSGHGNIKLQRGVSVVDNFAGENLLTGIVPVLIRVEVDPGIQPRAGGHRVLNVHSDSGSGLTNDQLQRVELDAVVIGTIPIRIGRRHAVCFGITGAAQR